MKSTTSFIIYCTSIIIAFSSLGFAAEDSTKTSVLKGVRFSFNIYEKLLVDWANCLKDLEYQGDSLFKFKGAKVPLGFDVELHFGTKKEWLRFPVGYSFMTCKNPGKDKDTYFRTSRHLLFGGALFFLNKFEKEKIVPYISGNLAYYIYNFKLELDIEHEYLEDLKLGDMAENGMSYYLTGGLIYCFEDTWGLAAGVNFNGKVNDVSFSVLLVSNVK